MSSMPPRLRRRALRRRRSRAQQVADQLQTEARQEAERLTSDLAVLREEARRLMAEAEADRADADRARKRAEEVLAGASEEAATIVVDANEQAGLLIGGSAGSARDQEVEQARLEGDRVRRQAQDEASRAACRGAGAARQRGHGEDRPHGGGQGRGRGGRGRRAGDRHAGCSRRGAPRPAPSRVGRRTEAESLRASASTRVRPDARRGHASLRGAAPHDGHRGGARPTRSCRDPGRGPRRRARPSCDRPPSRPRGPTATVRSVLEGAASEADAIRRAGHPTRPRTSASYADGSRP